jgi:hypothetical protein
MPLFQFTALDATGKEKRGTIEAANQQDAFLAIQRYGLHPTQVFPVVPGRQERPPPGPFAPPAPPGSSSAGCAVFFATVALLLALGSAGWQVYREFFAARPLGKGLKAYDFSTPEEACKSFFKVKMENDVRALAELERLRDGPRDRGRSKSLKVHEVVTWKDAASVVFYSFEEDKTRHFGTQVFERDKKSGVWFPKEVAPAEVAADKPDLAERMKEWAKKTEPVGQPKDKANGDDKKGGGDEKKGEGKKDTDKKDD